MATKVCDKCGGQLRGTLCSAATHCIHGKLLSAHCCECYIDNNTGTPWRKKEAG